MVVYDYIGDGMLFQKHKYALYVSSGNIPGAKLFHTEKDFDDMPKEILEAVYFRKEEI